MNKKNWVVIGGVSIILIIAIILAWRSFLSHSSPQPSIGLGTPLGSSTTEPQTLSSTTSQNPCSSDTSELAYMPSLPSGVQWIIPTSSTSLSGQIATSSQETNAVSFPDAMEAGNDNISLIGEARTANTSSSVTAFNESANYYNDLKQYGWLPEIDLGNGYKLTGADASGVNGEESGLIKVQNGYFRTIVFGYLQYPQVVMNVFISDILPISQIDPTYQSNCIE